MDGQGNYSCGIRDLEIEGDNFYPGLQASPIPQRPSTQTLPYPPDSNAPVGAPYPPVQPPYSPAGAPYPPTQPPYSPAGAPYPPTQPPYSPVRAPYPPVEVLATPLPLHPTSYPPVAAVSSLPYPINPQTNLVNSVSDGTVYPPLASFSASNCPSFISVGATSLDEDLMTNVDLNQGIGGKKVFSSSKLIDKALDKGSKLARQALNITPMSSDTPCDDVDGNCIGLGNGGGRLAGFLSPSSRCSSGGGVVTKFANQNYSELKNQCKSTGELFKDRQFSPSNRLLCDDNNQFVISYFGRSRFDEIEWMRPHEICQRLGLDEPEMFVGNSDRFDINQGEIGDCWFLAAVANLAENKKCFHRVVPQDQDFGHDYMGIFRFRFWRFGEWVEVVVDDRLPTRRGHLIYLRSVEKNEFWGALLEKAYAKLHGSYKNLEGGLTIEAAVDFTGGIPEMISLTNTKLSPERLFYIMSKADSRSAFMGCALSNSTRQSEAKTLGLQSRHAYTITKVVEIRSPHVRAGIPLIRLRNPHGNYKEWKGDWSDGDRNWRLIPKGFRSQLGLTFEDDGEFYMSFRDFLKYFGELEICHLGPDSVDVQDSRKKFEVFNFQSSWKAGVSAGGCGNDGNRCFATNPQFFINLNDPDPYDEETCCPVIISVAQKQKQRKSEHAIGFKIYRCNPNDNYLDNNFFNCNQSIDRVDTFINLREVSKRIVLPEGRYCIIPCTYARGEEGDFMVRVFVEKRWGSSELSKGLSVKDAVDASNQPFYTVTDGINDMSINPPDTDPLKGFFGKGRRNKMAGFALKQLEKNFPKGAKHLQDFYNWATDRDSEFALLNNIIKSVV